jgi:hypothetical protein
MRYFHAIVFACDECKAPIAHHAICPESPCLDSDIDERIFSMQCSNPDCRHMQDKRGREAVYMYPPSAWPN